ncbi:MAG: AsmA family protein [Acidobacteriaceae bacterium]|nr:AsmA family protein [Acidobacteriaceae bacterium]
MNKRILYVIAGVVVVLLLIVVLLPFFINANSFRPTVEAQLQTALGRKVEIGDLSLSLFSGGVTAKNFSIADDPKFSRSPFVQAKSLQVGVEMLPLITSRAVRITSLTVNQPDLSLVRSASGTWNFSSLGGHSAGNSSGQSSNEISIGKLVISDGRVTVGSANGQKSTYQNVNLTAQHVGYTSAIPFTLTAKTPGGGEVKVDGTAGPLDQADVSMSPLNAQVTVKHLDMAATGFVDPSSGIAGVLDYNGSVKSDGRVAQAEGNAKVQNMRLVRAGGPAKSPVSVDYASTYDLRRQAGTLSKGDIHFGSSTAHLGGTYDTHGDSTVVHMKLTGSQLPVHDVEGLLPAFGVNLPAGSSLQGGTADANLTLDGPVNRLVTAGNVNIANAKLSGFNLASKLSAVSALTGMKQEADTTIQTLSSNLRIAPDGIRADSLKLIVPALGTIAGSGTISPENALNFHMIAELANQNSAVGQLTSRLPMLGGKSSGGIPFMIQGTTAQPVFVPDVAGAVTGGLTKGLQGQSKQQGVGDLLNGILGKKK